MIILAIAVLTLRRELLAMYALVRYKITPPYIRIRIYGGVNIPKEIINYLC